MAWYYYSGSVSRAVKGIDGKTKSVSPHSKVELGDLCPQAKALKGKGQLRSTGRPKGLVAESKKVSDVKIEDVVKVAPWAAATQEIGAVAGVNDPKMAAVNSANDDGGKVVNAGAESEVPVSGDEVEDDKAVGVETERKNESKGKRRKK